MAYLVDFALCGGHMRLIVPILILLASFSLAGNGLHSLPSFLLFFLDEYFENSQFSIPTIISKLHIVSPHLHILTQHNQRRIMAIRCVDLISDIDEYFENTRNCKTHTATCTKSDFFLTDLPVRTVSDVAYLFDFALRGGHTCIIFFSWQWITMSLPSFLCSFLGENSQLSILTVISKFYIVFYYIDHGGTVYVDLISDINECPENTHTVARGKPLLQTPQCRKMHNEI